MTDTPARQTPPTGSPVAKKRGSKSKDEPDVPSVDSSALVPLKGGALKTEVLSSDQTRAMKVHERILDLMRQYEETYFELARHLYEVKLDNLYRHLDGQYDSFQTYVEDALGVDYRKAKYLVRVWWWFGIEQGADPKLLQGAQEIGWCLDPHTPITTINGSKPIFSVGPGDVIMDENGGWTKVVENMVFNFDEGYRIKVVKCGTLVASEGHGFDVIRKGVVKRREAHLDKAPFEYEIERVNAEDLCVGDMLVVPAVKPTDVGEFESMDDEFFEFAGWYVTEGFTYGGQLRISLGKDAEEERDHIAELAEVVFHGHEYSIRKNGGKHTGSFRVTVSGDGVDVQFDDWFGKGAYHKRIPTEFYSLPKEKVRAFVRGLCGGDGSRSEKGTHIVLTTSQGLAYQIRTLLTRLGVLAGVHHQKRDEPHHDVWIVTVSKFDAEEILGSWGREMIRSSNHYAVISEGFAVPVRSIELANVNGPLVHLETETGRFCCPVISYNTKSKELVEVIDKRNMDKWFKLAKDMNTQDLATAARVAKKKAEEARAKKAREKRQKEKDQAFNNEGPPFEKDGAGDTKPSKDDKDDDDQPGKGDTSHLKTGKPAKVKPLKEGEPLEEAMVDPDDEETIGADPTDDIVKEVEKKKAEKADWRRYIFQVHKDSAKTVDEALEFAQFDGETHSQGHALSLICLHYCSFHDRMKSVVVGEWLAQFERLTGLSVVAIDKRTDKIEYGQELIDELAAKEE